MKAGRFFAIADGAYNPDSLGATVATTWTGELVKKTVRILLGLMIAYVEEIKFDSEKIPDRS